jgi:hypothetical protein
MHGLSLRSIRATIRNMIRSLRTSRLFWLTVFGAAFGYLEGVVVVYLRALYYPDGFGFPAALPATQHLVLELGREAATLLMLLGTSMVAGRSAWDRFGIFCFLFGVWDIVFYLTLWGAVGWPDSLLTWDILFLIPLVWSGPVLSAVLVAASLCVAGPLISRWTERGLRPWTPAWVWAGGILAGLLLLASFMANHGVVRAEEIPRSFPWPLYLAGFALAWTAFVAAFRRRS